MMLTTARSFIVLLIVSIRRQSAVTTTVQALTSEAPRTRLRNDASCSIARPVKSCFGSTSSSSSSSSSSSLRAFFSSDDDDDDDDASASSSSPLLRECLAGVAVALSLVPKGVACAAIVGVTEDAPLVGVWSSVIVGVLATVGGARPGVVVGSAAVVAVPLGAFVRDHGGDATLVPVIVAAAAAWQVAVGLAGADRLILESVSESVLAGFLNALGASLLASQWSVLSSSGDGAGAKSFAVALLCAAVTELSPDLFAIPSSLLGLGAASVAATALGLPTLASTVADPTAVFSGGLESLPRFVPLPHADVDLFLTILPTSLSIAFVSVLETLLAARLVDDLKCEDLCVFFAEDDEDVVATPSSANNKGVGAPTATVLALAGGNAVSALTGGVGGCGLLPQTVLNLNAGGGGRASTLACAVALGVASSLCAPAVGAASPAALAGTLAVAGARTVRWRETGETLTRAVSTSTDEDETALVRARASCAALLLTAIVCYEVDFAAGVVLGVLVDKGALPLWERTLGPRERRQERDA